MLVAFLAVCASAQVEDLANMLKDAAKKNDEPKEEKAELEVVTHGPREGNGIYLNDNIRIPRILLTEEIFNHPNCTFHDGHGDVPW